MFLLWEIFCCGYAANCLCMVQVGAGSSFGLCCRFREVFVCVAGASLLFLFAVGAGQHRSQAQKVENY